jgi:glucokinase
MPVYSRQALVVAIGGTFISLAISDIDELTIDNFALLNSADFDDPLDAIRRYLRSVPKAPSLATVSVAGIVTGDSATMTHRPWTFTKADVLAATGAAHVTFVNDVEALALALPHMTSYELQPIGRGVALKDAARLVIASGTGLGSASLVWSGRDWLAVPAEAGHATFPAPRAGEFDIPATLNPGGFVAVEDVLSGRGLVALYAALAAEAGLTPRTAKAPEVTRLGLNGEDAEAARALDLIATWFGRFAGDVALITGARGGVYLAGGLAAAIVPHRSETFRAAFEAKGDFSSYLAGIPVNVIKTGADAGLRGAALALAREVPSDVRSFPRLASNGE